MQKTNARQKRVTPAPAAFMARAGGWKVEHNPDHAYVSETDGVYCAPLTDDIKSEATRAHEYGHLVYSPKCMESGMVDSGLITPEDIKRALADAKFAYTFNAIEDSRVNWIIYKRLRFASAHGAGLTAPAFMAAVRAQYVEARKTGTPKKLAAMEIESAKMLLLLTMAKIPAGIYSGHIAPRGWPGIKEFTPRQIIDAPLVVKCIPKAKDREEFRKALYKLSGMSNAAGIAFKIYTLLFANDDGLSPLQPVVADEGEDVDTALSNALDGVTWEIKTLPMATDKRRSLGVKRIASDAGIVPRKMHNILSSGRIFDRRGKSRGGTVLIDNSGSMHIKPDELSKIIKEAPAATIAIYDADAMHGALRIVAHNGLMASEDTIAGSRVGCGNVIDYYAMRWLAKQSEPRVWVCDGQVTGRGDSTFPTLTREVYRTAKMARVRREDSVADAMEFFHRRR